LKIATSTPTTALTPSSVGSLLKWLTGNEFSQLLKAVRLSHYAAGMSFLSKESAQTPPGSTGNPPTDPIKKKDQIFGNVPQSSLLGSLNNSVFKLQHEVTLARVCRNLNWLSRQ